MKQLTATLALLGCGALKELTPTHGEIKSMRTAPDFLRRGVARALLEHVIAQAAARGLKQLSLETGSGAAEPVEFRLAATTHSIISSAADSFMGRPSITSVGTTPWGLSLRYSGSRCAPFSKSTSRSSWGAPTGSIPPRRWRRG